MILLRKGCPDTVLGLRPLFYAPQGLHNSAQVSTLGIVYQGRRALQERQIERPTKRKRGPLVQLSRGPIAHSDFCAAIGASFI